MAAACTDFKATTTASPTPATSHKAAGSALMVSAKEPKRRNKALAIGLVSRRGRA